MSDFSSRLHWVTKKKVGKGFFSGINGCAVEAWWMLHVVQTAKLIRACLMQIWKREKNIWQKDNCFWTIKCLIRWLSKVQISNFSTYIVAVTKATK